MDKYQINALSSIKFTCVSSNNLQATVLLNNDILEITQNENYNINNYDLRINAHSIDKVEFYDGEWKNSDEYNDNYVKDTDSSLYLVPISFANKNTQKIRITFKGGLVDPVELDLNYVYADVESWNIKNRKEMLEVFNKNISIGNTDGSTYFKTLFFKPCSPVCKKTIVEWYVVGNMYIDVLKAGRNEKVQVHKTYYLSSDVIIDKREYSNSPIIAKKPPSNSPYVVGGSSFRSNYNWSSDGLGYIIRQYDEKDNLLIEKMSNNLEEINKK